MTYLDKYPSSGRLHFQHFSHFFVQFWGHICAKDIFTIFNILLMWSPDKEREEDHDDDLEEDHGEDMTAGLHGLFTSTCHGCTLLNTIP